jgi:DNA/RNA-binding domain of Phe-tRNA-synthetase-like protein
MLTVDPALLQAGLSVAAVVARGVDNSRTSPALLTYRRQVSRELAAYWKNRSLSSHPVLAEYERVHRLFGVENEPAAPEKLLRTLRRHEDLGAAGAVVDCYNLVSARTLVSIGAHDLARFETPITLRPTTANDRFFPLGETQPQNVADEYAYVEPDGRVICRLEVLQAEHSKVTAEARDIAFFLQDNRALGAGELLKASWHLAELVTTFCGGTAELVSFHDARRVAP